MRWPSRKTLLVTGVVAAGLVLLTVGLLLINRDTRPPAIYSGKADLPAHPLKKEVECLDRLTKSEIGVEAEVNLLVERCRQE